MSIFGCSVSLERKLLSMMLTSIAPDRPVNAALATKESLLAYLAGIGYFVLAIYLFVGFCGAAHVFSLRLEYHDRFKKLVKNGQLQNKYPSGISWLDSQNHWMIKGFQSQSDGKLKQLGEVLYDILPFLPPPQNLIFPVRYAYWLKRHWRLFNNDS